MSTPTQLETSDQLNVKKQINFYLFFSLFFGAHLKLKSYCTQVFNKKHEINITNMFLWSISDIYDDKVS